MFYALRFTLLCFGVTVFLIPAVVFRYNKTSVD
jgi:hypothetical protein